MPRIGLAIMMLPLFTAACWADPVIEDESKVPPYVLPDPLRMESGEAVTTPEAWRARRRPELLELFREHVYGRSPAAPPGTVAREVERDDEALDGSAVRRVVEISFGEISSEPSTENSSQRPSPAIRFPVYQPKPTAERPGPFPVFVGMHLFDRAAPIPLPGKPIVEQLRDGEEPPPGAHPGPETIHAILERGYAIASLTAADFAPDDAATCESGVIAMLRPEGATERAPDDWGAIGAWAWGLSRALDFFAADPELDETRAIVVGHSRMGKTALWAGAQDERFAAVISNESGCGGAALSKRLFGETVGLINKRFPHWFAVNFRQYNDREAELPVDQHQLLALIAPRPLRVASAAGDAWADPRGEFLSARGAEPVYRLFGKNDPNVAQDEEGGDPALEEPPPPDRATGGTLSYHVRAGRHALSDFDWVLYLDFADRALARR